MAQAPNPTGVMFRSEFPNLRVLTVPPNARPVHRKADASGLRGEAVDYHTVENRNKRKAMRRNKLAQDMKAIGENMQRGQQSLVQIHQSVETNLALSERSTSSDPWTLAATDLAAAGETQPEVA